LKISAISATVTSSFMALSPLCLGFWGKTLLKGKRLFFYLF